MTLTEQQTYIPSLARDRCLATWQACSSEQRKEGKWWYVQAMRDCCTSAGPNIDPITVADMAAILSPRVSWTANVRAIGDIVHRGEAAGILKRSQWGARAILDGARIEDITKGPKVLAFARALKGDTEAVVLDVWMWRALDISEGLARLWSTYSIAAFGVRLAARRLKVAPRDLQATLWVYQRGLRRVRLEERRAEFAD